MESILRRKAPPSSTREKLTAYFGTLMSVTILLIVFSLAMNLLGIWKFSRVVDEIAWVDSFFSEVGVLEDSMNQYVQINEEGYYQKALQKQEELLDSSQKLSKVIAVGNSSRIFQDIAAELENTRIYFEKSMRIIASRDQYASDMKWMDAYEQEYETAVKILRAIQSEKGPLDSLILNNMGKVRKKLLRQAMLSVGGMLLVLCLCGYLFYKKSRKLAGQITEPIEALAEKALHLESAGLKNLNQIEMDETENEEINHLTEAFNSLILCIRSQIEELKRSELKLLQRQINPHFLFNTLNMISYTAFLEDADKTVSLLGTAASFLRYSLDHADKTVQLYEEMEALGNYVYLQEQRFGERILFQFSLDHRLDQMKIPSLILQPLVENAVTHGIGSYVDNAVIQIRTQYLSREEKALICIKDNGTGMEEEARKALQKRMREIGGNMLLLEHKKHIGLENVCLRLSLFFEGNAEIRLESGEDAGMEVTLLLPCRGINNGQKGREME